MWYGCGRPGQIQVGVSHWDPYVWELHTEILRCLMDSYSILTLLHCFILNVVFSFVFVLSEYIWVDLYTWKFFSVYKCVWELHTEIHMWELHTEVHTCENCTLRSICVRTAHWDPYVRTAHWDPYSMCETCTLRSICENCTLRFVCENCTLRSICENCTLRSICVRTVHWDPYVWELHICQRMPCHKRWHRYCSLSGRVLYLSYKGKVMTPATLENKQWLRVFPVSLWLMDKCLLTMETPQRSTDSRHLDIFLSLLFYLKRLWWNTRSTKFSRLNY